MKPITSRNNGQVKFLASLRQPKHRKSAGLALAEGVHLVQDALASNVEGRTLVLSESFLRHPEESALTAAADKSGLEQILLSDSCYEKISDLRHPEGVALVFTPQTCNAEDLLAARDARLLLAAGVQDPGNAGALVRTAEAAGAGGCLFLGGVDLHHPRFLRGAQGSSFRLPCAAATEKALIQSRCRLIAAAADAEQLYTGLNYTPPVAICMGSEGGGLPEALLERAEEQIRIPMSGAAESLNVAVAAGIVLYEARRCWG